MSTAQYVEVFRAPTQTRPAYPPSMPLARQPNQRWITVALDSVMFTGRVPLSTWTFTLGIGDKLWVSNLTTLYFGKETRVNREIYQDCVPIQGHRVSLDMSVAVYNNYGDVIKAQRPIRFYELGSNVYPSALLPVEHNWMQLLFKFRLKVHASESV